MTLPLTRDEMIERAARVLHDLECTGRRPWAERPEFHRAMHLQHAEQVLIAAGAISAYA